MRTPRSYLRRRVSVLGCRCRTEAERLLCGAMFIQEGCGPLRELPPIPRAQIEAGLDFQEWMNVLSVNLWLSPTGLKFRAIMGDWSRVVILRELRKRKATEL